MGRRHPGRCDVDSVEASKGCAVAPRLVAALTISACTATSLAVARPGTPKLSRLPATCAARGDGSAIDWHISDEAEARELSRWCRAVGAPVIATVSPGEALPTLDELTVMSWNAHLAAGELDALIAKLKSGELTGRPVEHFVLLVQELYRRGDAVPAFDARDRSAFAIKARDPKSPDIDDHIKALGLSVFYVPSMRNGPELREDRGNAIISTEPLLDPIALELPLARQRRVTLGAAIMIQTPEGARPLQVLDAHLEPLSSPKTLWFFKDPRGKQVQAILALLATPRFTDPSNAGVVLGGDFNTVRSGAGEHAYHLARTWSSSLAAEDARDTHLMGRLDYLFFKLDGGWSASTRRLDERFGSDHYPVVGTFSR
jgi:endonuclease/exonuclease/phosphatase family metal-dependent hydrolase